MTHTTTNETAVEAINFNGLHTATTGSDFLTTDTQGKEFATLAAGFARAGHALNRTDPNDAARRFLEQIGVRL